MAEFVGDTFSSYAKCVELLEQLSLSLGHKLSHLALRWVLDFAPFACSLFGAKTDKQVQENIGADGWKLTKKSLQLIDSMTETCWR
jgi:aryl-alcohol dehydrogenase-like predicted oxidoreductase